MSEDVDYKAVLADMKARRDKLNIAIAAIEEMLGVEPSSQSGVGDEATITPPGGASDAEIRNDTFFGLSIPDAAAKYLRMTKKTATPQQITEALLRGGLKSASANLPNTVNSILRRRANNEGDFVKINRREWGLSEWYPGLSRRRQNAKAGEADAESEDGGSDGGDSENE